MATTTLTPANAAKLAALNQQYQTQLAGYQYSINSQTNVLKGYAGSAAITPGDPASPKAISIECWAVMDKYQYAVGSAPAKPYKTVSGMPYGLYGYYEHLHNFVSQFQRDGVHPIPTYLKWAYDFVTDPGVLPYVAALQAVATNSQDQTDLNLFKSYFITLKKTVTSQYSSYQGNLKTMQGLVTQLTTKHNSDVAIITGGGTLSTAATSTTSTTKPPKKPKVVVTTTAAGSTPGFTLPSDVQFNLPPHRWSLPTKPDLVNSGMSNPNSLDDSLRRGRFWFYSDSQQTFTQSATTAAAQGRTASQGTKKKYGFQFLWNPETWSTNVAVNPDVTPNTPQYWASSLPVFPSGQNLSLDILIDRTNDFACFGPALKGAYSAKLNALAKTIPPVANLPDTTGFTQAQKDLLNSLIANQNALTAEAAVLAENIAAASADIAPTNFLEFYANAGAESLTKITDLMQRGTLADIEYLYKTINGDGWVRLDQNTSDIGFLMMTLVEIEIGPSKYLGYLNNLSIEHQMFSENMIPMRSALSLQFVLMASAKVSQNLNTSSASGNSTNTSGS